MDLSIVRRLLVTQLMGLALLGVSGAPLLAEARGSKNPIEVGIVDWGRDFEAALAASERSGKPVFAFFQEVPGCSGCKKFGADVMSHPSIVQAVQSEFIPVLIYNNRNGKDAALLKRFGEPSWNYQVIRFLNAAGKDLIPRKDKVWTTDALSARMVLALQAAGRDVPKYLQALADETATSRHRTAAFGQHCFWTGEFELGRIPGVISTEAGWLDGSEVTRLTYHADQLSLESLVAQAANTDSARKIYLESEAERQRVRQLGGIAVGKLDDSYRLARTSDQKRQIRQSVLYQLDLTPMQQTKVNALAPIDLQAALAWLTPDQLARFHELRAKQGR